MAAPSSVLSCGVIVFPAAAAAHGLRPPQDFEAVDPALALAHHNMSWRNPAEFRIVLTGNVDRAALEPLLCAYLATIPKTGLPPPKLPKEVTPLPYSFPEEPVVEDVKVAMVSPVAQAQITFPVSLSRPVAREELVWLSLVCRALETRLLQKMRFVAGDVYTERQNRHRPGGHSAASRTRFRARSRSPGPLKFNTAAMSAMQEPHWAHDSVGAGVDTTSDTQSLAFPVPTDTEAALEDFEGADAVLDVFGNLHDLGSGTSLDSETMELLRKDCAGDFADVSGPVCDGLAGVWLSLVCRALETRLLQKMRFVAGDVYTVAVSPFFGCVAPSLDGDPRGDIAVMFSCDPANKQRLVGLVLEEVSALQQADLADQEVATLVNLDKLTFENSQAENSYWHDLVVTGYQSKSYQLLGGDLSAVYDKNMEAREKVLGSCTPATLRAAMCRLFPRPPTCRYTAIAMLPRPPGLFHRLGAALAARWFGTSGSYASTALAPPSPAAVSPGGAGAGGRKARGPAAAEEAGRDEEEEEMGPGGAGRGSLFATAAAAPPGSMVAAAVVASVALSAGVMLWAKARRR
ncbi:hypothetical protein CHLRE_16g647500v5 [Chlamydomonas reinhardtii]|uniref:Peptidase M16 C-terminal domain-containing protein n=1 Tax=Chlamydomonas reinhardtii TaxID=3055 RepID=A0A2K3CSK6_CHLRE|nr:uncharacterized protein CHLRE_16g647500v5 [Chlamydomonas reinhardtii]PNW71277.1 hypothetical protein CHLRE_16g647500v5 [Chlamydomonas reinhardtii]